MKAKEIVGIDCESNALDWMREVLRMRFDEVAEFREPALDAENIEGIHDIRVAIRRLRSALQDFLPMMKLPLLQKSRRELKSFGRTLGKIRDRDVAIGTLEKWREIAEDENIKAGIEKKITKSRTTREEMQISLAEVLDLSAFENLRENFFAAIDEALEKNKDSVKLTAKEMGRKIILRNLRDFRNLTVALYNPFSRNELHELRIAAKRLRYAIKLFSVCWGEEISPFAKEIGKMQTFLGEVHDCDLWIENLSRRLSKKNGKKSQTDLWLLSIFTKNRTANYRAALELSGEWQNSDFVKRLRAILRDG